MNFCDINDFNVVVKFSSRTLNCHQQLNIFLVSITSPATSVQSSLFSTAPVHRNNFTFVALISVPHLNPRLLQHTIIPARAYNNKKSIKNISRSNKNQQAQALHGARISRSPLFSLSRENHLIAKCCASAALVRQKSEN
jgi:hypothetical protein